MCPSPGIERITAPRAGLAAAREPTACFLQQLVSELVLGPEKLGAGRRGDEVTHLLQELLEIDESDARAPSRDGRPADKLALRERLLRIEEAGIRPRGTTGRTGRGARLMALPVLITTSREMRCRDLGKTGSLDSLAASLKGSGLVSPQASVVIARYFYHPDELRALSSSHGFRLAQRMFAQPAPVSAEGEAAEGEAAEGRASVTAAVWPDELGKCADDSLLSLGFLVLAIIDGEPPIALQPSLDSGAARLTAADVWIRHAGPLLTSALDLQPGASARIVGCSPFHEGLRQGLQAFREIGLRCTVKSLLARCQLCAKAVAAVIAAYADDTGITEVRLSLVGVLTDALLDGEVFAVRDGDEAEEVADRIAVVLRGVGIHNITHRKYALPIEAKGVKQRIFLTSRKLEQERSNNRPELFGIAGASRLH